MTDVPRRLAPVARRDDPRDVRHGPMAEAWGETCGMFNTQSADNRRAHDPRVVRAGHEEVRDDGPLGLE